jgi:HSP20 family protein
VQPSLGVPASIWIEGNTPTTNGLGGDGFMTLLNRWERWDPFAELNSLQGQMDRLFRDTFNFNDTFQFDGSSNGGVFVPPADVYETPESIQLRLEIPGVDEKDLNITMENGVLTVRGVRKLEEGEKEQNFLRMERPYGAFSRSFTLPQTVDADHIRAKYVSGVLLIELTKRAEAKPKQIPISRGQKALGVGIKAAA